MLKTKEKENIWRASREKTANIQAKAKNMRAAHSETEKEKQTERQGEPVILPFLKKTGLRLDSKRFPTFIIINPL